MGRKILDWVSIALQIAAPIIGVCFAIFNQNPNYTEAHRLATIVAGITIQIVLQGLGQKGLKDTARENRDAIKKLEASSSFTTEMSTILASGEERRIQYARRRLTELEDVLRDASSEKETRLLPVSTYYSELNALKEDIEKDKKPDKCEIWAMTGFSNKEWDVDDNALEKQWCESLMGLVKKIQTNRVCIIDSALLKCLEKKKDYYEAQKKQWCEHAENPELNQQKNLKSFFDYLSAYYSREVKGLKISNYCLVNEGQTAIPAERNLIEARGFFGIKLSNGRKYVIRGEAVDPLTGLQGQYVFSEKDVSKLYESHKYGCREFCSLEDFIKTKTSKEFQAFLTDNNIDLDKYSKQKIKKSKTKSQDEADT